MELETYRRKRDFAQSPEPKGAPGREPTGRPRAGRAAALQFVVQKHAARRLHYDLRLELDGVLLSWAVPRGPSLDPRARRLAVKVEDHPLEYAGFEGVIPPKQYGAGAVIVWDWGAWVPEGDPTRELAAGRLHFRLEGQKLRGEWRLVRTGDDGRGRERWLLFKARDEEARTGAAAAIVERAPRSVVSGRDLDAVAADADRTWTSEGEAPADPGRTSSADVATLAGARPAPLPDRLPAPQLATAVEGPPGGDGWLSEIKLDGYRLIARVDHRAGGEGGAGRRGGPVRLVTRQGHDWTARFPTIAEALAALPCETALLDGEAVVLDRRGVSRFEALQNALGQRRPDLFYVAFDLLHRDGVELCGVSQRGRKEALRRLLARGPLGGPLRYGEHVEGPPAALLREACRLGLEGIVCKRADAPWRAGRTRAWVKVKCLERQELVVVGYTEPAGSRVGFGALALAAREEGAWRYCGKVGTGFSGATLRALLDRLRPLARRDPPFPEVPVELRRGGRVHWVEPRLVVEVAFAEWTAAGVVRHARYEGLREDRPPEEVVRERKRPAPRADGEAPPEGAPPAARAAAETSRAGTSRAEPSRAVEPAPGEAAPAGPAARVRFTHPKKVLYPDLGLTKADLAQYYALVADRMLPQAARRPLTLVRCPNGASGTCFYQKHAYESVPDAVPRVAIPGKDERYLMLSDLPSVLHLVQLGVLEFNVWCAQADRLDRPDLLVIDLDPGPDVGWPAVVDAAQRIRAQLERVGLTAFARVTGGKGLHLVVPIERRATWEEARAAAEGIARGLAKRDPQRFTAVMAKRERTGRIFVDYLRVAPEATAVASFSTRARPGGFVALPRAWDDLEGPEPPRITVRDVLAAPDLVRGPDPWRGFEDARARLTRAAQRELGAG
jgi:bifunctional non-homologous end joining protein LigD